MAAQRTNEDNAADGPAAVQPSAGEDAPLKLEKFLPYQLNVVASLTSQALSRVYSRRYGIGVPEWRVLVTLGQYGVMTGKAIGAHTHMHKTKVSRAAALLEKRKLLVRRANRADMRESFLSLTAAGRSMYQELAPHALDFARRLTEILNASDRDAFNRALKQLTHPGDDHDFTPEFAPAGDKIAFERDSPDFSTSSILVMNPDGSNPTPIQADAFIPAWGPAS